MSSKLSIEDRLQQALSDSIHSDSPSSVCDAIEAAINYIENAKAAIRVVILRHDKGYLAGQNDSLSIDKLRKFAD